MVGYNKYQIDSFKNMLSEKFVSILNSYMYSRKRKAEAKEKCLDTICQNSLEIFEKVNQILQNDKEQLNGEFSVFNAEFPLFVILDMIYLIVVESEYTILDEDKLFFTSIIAATRELKFSSKFKKFWNINPSFLKAIQIDTVSPELVEKSCDFLTFSETKGKRDKLGNRVFYKSTIKTYESLFKHSHLEDKDLEVFGGIESILGDDLESYPALVSDDIFLLSTSQIRHEWNTWTPHYSNQRIILFNEQQEELKAKYKILETVAQKKVGIKIKNYFLENAMPFFENKTFNEFVLIDFPWEKNENTYRIKLKLENIYAQFITYKEMSEDSNFTLQTALESYSFLMEIYIDLDDINISIEKEKKEIISYLEHIYNMTPNFMKRATKTFDQQEEFDKKLKKLPLPFLYNLVEQYQNSKIKFLSYPELIRNLNRYSA